MAGCPACEPCFLQLLRKRVTLRHRGFVADLAFLATDLRILSFEFHAIEDHLRLASRDRPLSPILLRRTGRCQADNGPPASLLADSEQPMARAPLRGPGDFQHRPHMQAPLVQRPRAAAASKRLLCVRTCGAISPPSGTGNGLHAPRQQARRGHHPSPLKWWPRLLLPSFRSPIRGSVLARRAAQLRPLRARGRACGPLGRYNATDMDRGSSASAVKRNATARNSITLCGNAILSDGNKITPHP